MKSGVSFPCFRVRRHSGGTRSPEANPLPLHCLHLRLRQAPSSPWSSVCLAFAWALVAGNVAAGPTAETTEVIGPFTGVVAKLHPLNTSPHTVRYYGTDLGFSYAHGGKLQFLFGDTMADDTGARLEPETNSLHDDMIATIDLAEWPDPRLITPNNIPLLLLPQRPDSAELFALDPGHVMDGLKTPEAGFSSGEREFAIFILTKPLGCTRDAECGSELACAPEVGFFGVPYTQEAGLTLGCIEGRPGCTADTMADATGAPVPESGLCVDHSSSLWQETQGGRVAAVAMKQRIALRSVTDPNRYQGISDWLTNKFINTTVSTVQDFGPGRGAGHGNQDYRIAGASGDGRRVLLWGRPGFIGVGAKGRPMNLYFAYADMPVAPDFGWALNYFTGIGEKGIPEFSRRESEAEALDLDAATPGAQPNETVDIIQHMTVAWIEPLKKWVMFYGGGIDRTPVPQRGLGDCGILEIFSPSDCKDVVMGQGSIYMRTADDPWGPWSKPQEVIAGGDPDQPGSGQYRPGGVLYHSKCVEDGCAQHSPLPPINPNGYGWFYGANIIEQWIVPAGDGVDVLWNASTWDPYRVILLRTHISP